MAKVPTQLISTTIEDLQRLLTESGATLNQRSYIISPTQLTYNGIGAYNFILQHNMDDMFLDVKVSSSEKRYINNNVVIIPIDSNTLMLQVEKPCFLYVQVMRNLNGEARNNIYISKEEVLELEEKGLINNDMTIEEIIKIKNENLRG